MKDTCSKALHKLKPLSNKEINGIKKKDGSIDSSTIIGKKGDLVCTKCGKVFRTLEIPENHTGITDPKLPNRLISFRDFTVDGKTQKNRVAFDNNGNCCGGPSLLFDNFGLKMGMTVMEANRHLKKFKIRIGIVVAIS